MDQAQVSKKLLQELIDNAALVMKLSPITSEEQKKAYLALSKSIDDLVRSVTQSTASVQSFSGTETGNFHVDAGKSSFV